MGARPPGEHNSGCEICIGELETQEGQHHVSAAKDEGAGTIERLEQGDGLGVRRVAEYGQPCEKQEEESNPCCEAAKITGAHETKREPDLAACWPRQKLAQRHQIGASLLIEPAPFNDEL